MKVAIEQLLRKEVAKVIILETFQDFLLEKSKKDTKESDSKSKTEIVEEPINKAKTGKVESKKKGTKKSDADADNSMVKSSEMPITKAQASKIAKIKKLKSYVFTCGVQKIW